MKVKRRYIVASALVLFFVSEAVMLYHGSKVFPKWERETMEDMIKAGKMRNCSWSNAHPEFGTQFENKYSALRKTCFPRSTIDDQIVLATPGRPEVDQVYFQLSCSTDAIAARFQFVFSRSGIDTMCVYLIGDDLRYIPKLSTQDMIMPPDKLWWPWRTIIRLSD